MAEVNPFEAYVKEMAGGKPAATPDLAPEPVTPGLRRETGIGWPTIGALGGLAAGALLLRRPGMVQKLDTLWQRPLKGLERYTAGRPVNLPHIGIPGMPSELPLLHAKPLSILTSEMERVGTHMAEKTKGLVEQPWAKETLKQSPDVIKDIENSRVADFMARMTTGGMSPSQAKAASMANAPQWFQEADAFRVATKAGPYGENWAKRFLGLQQTPERWGPYWARNVVKDETASLRGTQGLFGELRTSVGPAERARKYPTMRAGEQAGIQYDDPRVAWLKIGRAHV